MVSRATPAGVGRPAPSAPERGGWGGEWWVPHQPAAIAAFVGLMVLLAALAGALPPALAMLALTGAVLVGVSFAEPKLALAALIFSVPFSVSIPFSQWLPFQVSFQLQAGSLQATATDLLVGLLLLAWIARGLTRGSLVIRGGPTLWAGLALLGSALVSTLGARDFPTALEEDIKLAEMVAVGLYAASQLRRPEDVRFVLATLVAAGACEALVALGLVTMGRGPTDFSVGRFARAYGDFAQPNGLAGYLAMILPFGIVLLVQGRRWRGPAIFGTLLIAAALLATFSRGAWLGELVGLGALALGWSQRVRRRFLVASVVVVLGVILSAGALHVSLPDRVGVLLDSFAVFDARRVQPDPTNWSVVERMAHWQAGWDMAQDYPLFGVGPGNYEAAYVRYFVPGWPHALGHAHNLYINMFAELGIIGLAIFLGFTLTVFVRVGQGLLRTGAEESFRRGLLLGALAATLAFSVHNLFDNMLVHGMGVQFGLILGMVEWAAHAHRD